MSLTQKIILVDGEKIESMVLAENEIQLLNKTFDSMEEFDAAWKKKITLTNKVKIEYSEIKSITKEEAEEEIEIKYSSSLGTKTCKITFQDNEDRSAFYAFLIDEKGFARTDERISAFAASKTLLISLVVVAAIAVFGYLEAVAMQSPDFVENDSSSRSGRRARLFHSVLGYLGPNGTLLVGLAIVGFIGYKLWMRYTNPPVVTKFTPTK